MKNLSSKATVENQNDKVTFTNIYLIKTCMETWRQKKKGGQEIIMIYLGASFNIYFKWMGAEEKKKNNSKWNPHQSIIRNMKSSNMEISLIFCIHRDKGKSLSQSFIFSHGNKFRITEKKTTTVSVWNTAQDFHLLPISK